MTRGRYLVLECFDQGKLLWREKAHNLLTDEYLNGELNRELHGATQINPWYCVISESNTSPAASMTYAVPVFTELTAYDEATRPEYVEAAASSKSVTNAANKAVFTINASKTLYGAGLVGGGSDPSVKNDKAGGGTLRCYTLFSASHPVAAGQVVNLTYVTGGADDGV